MKWAESIINKERGQSLIELMIAMGVFVLVVSVISWLIIDVYLSDRSGRERMEATLLAQEGIEAVRSMRDSDFDNLNPGTYGLALSGSNWIFSGSYDDHDKFRRQIVVSNVTSEIDQTDIKKVQSQVTWQITPVRQVSVTLTDYLTDWKQSQGQAGNMITDIASVSLNPPDNDQLRNIKIQNIGATLITIDKMTVWWNGLPKIKQIKIEGTNVYGPVADPNAVPSGTEIDISNFSMASGSGIETINMIKFTGDVSGTDFIVKFIMTDGSTKYTFIDL